ncbi:MAG: S49 family peptidase [Legionella sp.]|nr:S49 family peptidase [Legionella sp.]
MNNRSSEENPDSQALLNKIVIEFMHEQKRKRIWRWTMRSIILILIIVLIFKFVAMGKDTERKNANPHAGLIDLKGTIFDSKEASADNFAKGLASAYKKTGLKALIIRINSPGGSPVQADYMYNALKSYRKAYPDIKIYAVCVDMCASAAYYVAAAADEIYANESSMVGSIGVLYNGFGFVDTLQKLGVTRRLQTSGRNKGFLDPFSPVSPDQQLVLQGMLNDIHQQFINKVKLGRGARLKIDDETFSGLFWTGVKAKERGLIDGFSSSRELAKEQLKLDSVVNYTYEQSMLERVGKTIGIALAGSLPEALGLDSGVKASLR